MGDNMRAVAPVAMTQAATDRQARYDTIVKRLAAVYVGSPQRVGQ